MGVDEFDQLSLILCQNMEYHFVSACDFWPLILWLIVVIGGIGEFIYFIFNNYSLIYCHWRGGNLLFILFSLIFLLTPLSKLEGPAVLQVLKLRNISAPKDNEESQTAPKLWKMTLTDGQSSCLAIALEPIKNMRYRIFSFLK